MGLWNETWRHYIIPWAGLWYIHARKLYTLPSWIMGWALGSPSKMPGSLESSGISQWFPTLWSPWFQDEKDGDMIPELQPHLLMLCVKVVVGSLELWSATLVPIRSRFWPSCRWLQTSGFNFSLFFFLINLFIWLCQVLVVAHGIFIAACGLLSSCSLQALERVGSVVALCGLAALRPVGS